MAALDPIPAPWGAIALVCRKCGKKLGGGFGKKEKHPLAEELRSALKQAGQRRAVRVMEVGCLGLCPKSAVAVAAEGGVVLSVPGGTDPASVVAALLPPALLPSR